VPTGTASVAVLQRAATRFAASRLEPALGTKRGQVAEIGVCRKDDVAARAPVAAVGATLRDMLLAAEVQAAVAAATRLHMDAGAVVEHARLVRRVGDFDKAALAALLVRNCPASRREDGVVATDAGAVTGAELPSALAHEDHSGPDRLAREDLHAEHLRIRVTPVA
jgi:hypothetical protein